MKNNSVQMNRRIIFLSIKIKYSLDCELIKNDKVLQIVNKDYAQIIIYVSIANYTSQFISIFYEEIFSFLSFSLKNNPLLLAKVFPDEIHIFPSSFWLQFATFIPVDFASPAQTEAENFHVSSKFLSRATRCAFARNLRPQHGNPEIYYSTSLMKVI